MPLLLPLGPRGRHSWSLSGGGKADQKFLCKALLRPEAAHVGVGRDGSNPQPWKLCHMPVCPHTAGVGVGVGEAGPAQPSVWVSVSSPAG